MDNQQPIKVDDRLRHIAFIMDGNGRWAKKRGLPREVGHRQGAKTFQELLRYCGKIGLQAVTLYAFSTENWKRPPKEVDSIFKLLDQYLDTCEREMDENDIAFHFLGDKSIFKPALRERLLKVERLSAGKRLTCNIALNYGARAEIAQACRELMAEGKRDVTEEDIAAHLSTAHCGDPDLIVRTGGDLRLSNFLLWQAAYAELYFTDTFWPDFGAVQLNAAIADFYSRKRNFGAIDQKV